MAARRNATSHSEGLSSQKYNPIFIDKWLEKKRYDFKLILKVLRLTVAADFTSHMFTTRSNSVGISCVGIELLVEMPC